MPKLVQALRKHLLRFLALGLWLGIFALVQTAMTINHLSFTEFADAFIKVLRNKWYGPLLFIALDIVRPLFLIPGAGTVMNVMAGMVYGLGYGLPISLLANGTSATMTYSASRWFIHRRPEITGRTGKFVEFMRHNPLEAILTMQLSYVSLDFTSSMAGILHLPFRPFLLAVMLGGLVTNGIGVFVGSRIEGSLANGDLTIQPQMIVISAFVLICSWSLSFYLRRRTVETFKEKSYAPD